MNSASPVVHTLFLSALSATLTWVADNDYQVYILDIILSNRSLHVLVVGMAQGPKELYWGGLVRYPPGSATISWM